MIGQTIGNFVVVQKIGHGGMGEVYVAEQRSIKTKVAIKVLLPHVSANRDHVQRFFNEAVAVSRIKHSGIAKIFDVGFTDSGQAYLVMEFLEGETLASRIHRLGRVPAPELAEIGRQISNVLEATHQAGITHRDLKPENIFLVPDAELETGERVKILDFGIAKLGGGASLTSTSMGSMGTPAYMAPEQWHNSKTVDWRADAYSLGCLVYEMAAGRPPFIVESLAEACTKHLTEIPQPLRQVAAGSSPELEGLVARLLQKDPGQRPASMKDVTRTFADLRNAKRSAPALQPTIVAPDQNLPHIAPTVPVISTPLSSTTLSSSASHQLMRSNSDPSRKRLAAILGITLVGALAAVIAMTAFPTQTTKPSASAAVSESQDAAALPRGPVVTDISVDAASADQRASLEAPIVDAGANGQIIDAGPKVGSAAPKQRKGSAPAVAAAPAASLPCPPADDTQCDEVSCVLNNYEGACCCKFRKGYTPPHRGGQAAAATSISELPDGLDRSMIAAGINRVKARVAACGDKSPAKGKIKVKVRVSPEGSISEALIDTTPDEELGECVRLAVLKATFPRTQKGGSFSYPFVF